jgi:hypothetical protein
LFNILGFCKKSTNQNDVKMELLKFHMQSINLKMHDVAFSSKKIENIRMLNKKFCKDNIFAKVYFKASITKTLFVIQPKLSFENA